MRKLRRSIANAYAQEMGMKRLGRRFWGFWRDVQKGIVNSGSAQIKAIEKVRDGIWKRSKAVRKNRKELNRYNERLCVSRFPIATGGR